MVFDLTNKQSFDHLGTWRSEFLDKSMPKDPTTFPFFVIGNKSDMVDERVVPETLIQGYLEGNKSEAFFETSASNGSNIEELFNSIGKHHLGIISE